MIVTVANPAESIFYLGGPPAGPGRMRLDYRDIVAADPCAYCGVEEIEAACQRQRAA